MGGGIGGGGRVLFLGGGLNDRFWSGYLRGGERSDELEEFEFKFYHSLLLSTSHLLIAERIRSKRGSSSMS